MSNSYMDKEEKLKAAMEAARLFLNRGELLLAYWRDGGSLARLSGKIWFWGKHRPLELKSHSLQFQPMNASHA